MDKLRKEDRGITRHVNIQKTAQPKEVASYQDLVSEKENLEKAKGDNQNELDNLTNALNQLKNKTALLQRRMDICLEKIKAAAAKNEELKLQGKEIPTDYLNGREAEALDIEVEQKFVSDDTARIEAAIRKNIEESGKIGEKTGQINAKMQELQVKIREAYETDKAKAMKEAERIRAELKYKQVKFYGENTTSWEFILIEPEEYASISTGKVGGIK